jgi:hypothetical protein
LWNPGTKSKLTGTAKRSLKKKKAVVANTKSAEGDRGSPGRFYFGSCEIDQKGIYLST